MTNRQQRRAAERAGQDPAKPGWTREQTQRFLDEAFSDRIGFVAARTLLVRVTNDRAWSQLDGELRQQLATFLERHPEPLPRGGAG